MSDHLRELAVTHDYPSSASQCLVPGMIVIQYHESPSDYATPVETLPATSSPKSSDPFS